MTVFQGYLVIRIVTILFLGCCPSFAGETTRRTHHGPIESADSECNEILTVPSDTQAEGHPEYTTTDLFSKALAHDERNEGDIFDEDEALKQAYEDLKREHVIASDQDELRYIAAKKLRPLFDSGVVYQAIVSEFVHRGFRTKKKYWG